MGGRRKKYRTSFIIASITTSIFIYLILPPSGFNIIPYSIYQHINSNGSGESAFIVFFDILSVILLFWIVYKTIDKLWQ